MQAQSEQPILVGRLSPDRELARHAAFALFVLVYLEQAGLVPRRFVLDRRSGVAEPPLDELPGAVAEIRAHNPYILAHFDRPARAAALGGLDAAASRELLGWLQAQHVAAEEPQIAYELGMLALGVELPGILVRGLREAEVHPESRVAELPDGSGYPTVFLSALHPAWRAAEHARLFVESPDAAQLAAWAMLLLAKRLAPPPGSIERVSPTRRAPLEEAELDLALVYNPVPWLAAQEAYCAAVKARQILLL